MRGGTPPTSSGAPQARSRQLPSPRWHPRQRGNSEDLVHTHRCREVPRSQEGRGTVWLRSITNSQRRSGDAGAPRARPHLWHGPVFPGAAHESRGRAGALNLTTTERSATLKAIVGGPGTRRQGSACRRVRSLGPQHRGRAQRSVSLEMQRGVSLGVQRHSRQHPMG